MLGHAGHRKPQTGIESGECWIPWHDRIQLEAADSEAWCGVQIIELKTGACVDWFRIDGGIAELYGVAVIPGFATPMVLSPASPELANLITWNNAGAGAGHGHRSYFGRCGPRTPNSSQEHSTDLRS
jgi:hypothetical protein